MPLMNGYTACIKLKDLIREGKVDDMKIVACTADTSSFNVKKCKECQFDQMINKPVIKTILANLLNRFSMQPN